MREIKFRVWNKDNRKLLGYEYFNTILNSGFFYTNLSEIGQGQDESDLVCHSDYHNPPMLRPENLSQLYREQFTGLKDKNDKEIYEGDICRILYTGWPSSHDNSISLDEYLISISHVGVVVFDDLSFQLEMYNNRYNDHSLYSMHCGTHGRIEVIGNIHQNKELLK